MLICHIEETRRDEMPSHIISGLSIADDVSLSVGKSTLVYSKQFEWHFADATSKVKRGGSTHSS